MMGNPAKRIARDALLGVALLALAGCSHSVPPGSIVLTQAPSAPVSTSAPECTLDLLYPPGSRIVVAEMPLDPNRVRVLSEGLSAAGAPVVAYDGRRVFFSGKQARTGEWQIYEVPITGGRPEAVTAMPGGAGAHALLPDGSLVFTSPVPKPGGAGSAQSAPALYRQFGGGPLSQLTFAQAGADDPTVLSDGRILFISARSSSSASSASGLALYTINNDGTEISAFAAQHDSPAVLRQPRELADGRIVFLVSPLGSAWAGGAGEIVRMARPFHSRAQLFPNTSIRIGSVEPASGGSLLVCAEDSLGSAPAGSRFALFRIGAGAGTLGAPLLADPAWAMIEAVEAAAHRAPMGRLSSVDPAKKTGRILCLDANYNATRSSAGGSMPTATQVRVLTAGKPGHVCVLAEVPMQADGSFLVEVPADTPLGFETLDAQGLVVNRMAPTIWVRPGENRSCIGCHEPHNHTPHNVRPIALRSPCTPLNTERVTLALEHQ
jgi:hypothetical protein